MDEKNKEPIELNPKFKLNKEMDSGIFNDFAKEMVDYVAGYLENIRERRVLPEVKPGYMRPLLPAVPPQHPDKWQDVMADVEKVIMPGVTHWSSPHFHAFFPSVNSYPSIVGDMLSASIGCVGLSWFASPACMELEVIMLDWLVKMLGLPKSFLASNGSNVKGLIQGSVSESTFVALLGAKVKTIARVRKEHPDWKDSDIVAKLVGYTSRESHSSVERAGLLGGIQLRSLQPDDDNNLRGETLEKAIEEDIAAGLIPFYTVATLGTTSSCAFDALSEIGPICNSYNIWLHVDAAYAGSSFICPEYRYLMEGIETVDSFIFSPHKWLLVSFDCSAMWLKEPAWLEDAPNVDPLYLKHDQHGSVPDCRHLQIPLSRRFRALKLWFVLRLYGVENLQKLIRKHIALAHYFEDKVRNDPRFEVTAKVLMGLVCFRLKGTNELNQNFLKRSNSRGVVYLIAAESRDQYFLRFVVCSRFTKQEDIDFSWNEISHTATKILNNNRKLTNGFSH